MRLIDADELVKKWTIASPEPYNTDAVEVLDSIREAPTVDAVVVTRCKDCRSYNKPKTGWCEVHLDREHPDDFCSFGERKDVGDG